MWACPRPQEGFRCSENSVRNWLARFSEDGIDGLRDLPRSGCRPRVDRKKIAAIMDLSIEYNSTDVMTVRDDIRDATGIEYSIEHVRRLMRQYGLSRRKVQNVHVNHAAPSSVYAWQWYLEDVRIPCLKREGFTLVSSDEAFFVQGAYDRYVWGSVGTRSVASYSGDRTRVAVFGGIAEDGRKLFRTFTGSFTSVQFIQCLEALRKVWQGCSLLRQVERAQICCRRRISGGLSRRQADNAPKGIAVPQCRGRVLEPGQACRFQGDSVQKDQQAAACHIRILQDGVVCPPLHVQVHLQIAGQGPQLLVTVAIQEFLLGQNVPGFFVSLSIKHMTRTGSCPVF